jgi:hypothetical protein
VTTKQNWICSLCGQTFTRNTSGKRHNLNLHAGLSQIVNYTEYYVGRLNGKYLQPSHSPSSFRRKKSLETTFLDGQEKQQPPNNTYNSIPNLFNIKNTKFYDIYNGALAESEYEISSNNFFLDNTAQIGSLIEEFENKLQPFLNTQSINEFIKIQILFPLYSWIDTKEKFINYKKQLDNVYGYIRIAGVGKSI